MSDTAVSTVETPSKALSDGKFTTESALKTIRKQEAKIQKLAKDRTEKPKSLSKVKEELSDKAMEVAMAIPILGVGFSGTTLGIQDMTNGAADPELILIQAMVGSVGAILLMTVSWITDLNQKVFPALLRRKLRKKLMQQQLLIHLWEMGEEEYYESEQKAISKAQPALDYLNSKMESREFVFISSDKKKAKFVLKDKALTDDQKAIIEVERTHTLALESTKQNPVLSITQKQKEAINV